ncbi:jasmonate-induced oxygenase 1-like isoform X1 [Aristolochia californica]|uniref:jasmonate-induced oxygenase 1-like isoform X1 n=1 Tax=Aristolochia californica TaxID=171875 RepID=UPI0035D99E68
MDLPQRWPEPIVNVQALSERGLNAVPERYIKPPSDRPLPCYQANLSDDNNIPLIDMAGLDGPTRDDTMRRISDACRKWGFFQVVNHGVKPELLKETRQVWRQFFHSPLELKKAYANSPRTYEGYGSRLGVEKGAILDWGDYYFLHVLPPSLKNHDKWPAFPSNCREVLEEYSTEVVKLGGRLMKLLSTNLGLEDGYLQRAFGGEDIGACLRVNFYPKCPQPELTLGLSPHSDPGGLTLLLPDERVHGLQVRRGDFWVTVHPAPDSFIVNIGDQIQVVSNAIYKSVEHRVAASLSDERLSLAFFYNPKSDIPIAPAPPLVSPERPALYQPMSYEEYRLFIRKGGPRGKALIESLKTT